METGTGNLHRVKTVAPVYGGYALARLEGIGVLFVRWALPGEELLVRIGERKRDYAFAEAVAVLAPSPHRVDAPCEVFGDCGGCQIQNADYPYQLEMKREVLSEAFRRIGRMEVDPSCAPPGEPFGYRYRGQFKTDGEAVGFFAERSRRLVPVSRCPLMVDAINRALPALRGLGEFAPAGEIHLASDGARVAAWLPGVRFDPRIAGRAGEGLHGIVFEDRAWGEGTVTLPLDGLPYSVSPRSFFQANWRMNLALVGRLASLLAGAPEGRVLDLYAGAGNFALPLARRCGEVVAVEGESRAFADLRENVRRNALPNVLAVASRVEAYRPVGRFDAVVLDPPRAGLSPKALSLVRRIAAGRILYVSCNPSTLARDIRALSDRYEMAVLEMHDFFPNTHHVEALAVLAAR
ncbi:MAG TPA: class I SAM-dependent RNA methyltransferase [Candidatus Deferrimicrobiaceae bacterium]